MSPWAPKSKKTKLYTETCQQSPHPLVPGKIAQLLDASRPTKKQHKQTMSYCTIYLASEPEQKL
eukprot:1154243-Pelagomonas_calceolata.AAC.5